MARLGKGDRAWPTLCLPRDGPYEPKTKDIVSISRGLLLDPSLRRFAAAHGIFLGTWIRPVGAGERLGYISKPRQFTVDAENASLSTSPSSGMGPATPASVVEDRDFYEMHVRGFYHSPQVGRGAHPGNLPRPDGKDSLSQNPGSEPLVGTDACAGVSMKLLSRARNPQHQVNRSGITGDTIPWLSLHPKLPNSSAGGWANRSLEFKEMVRAFHKAGIEVILDVVFNHTAEGNELGPTLCFPGDG